MAGEYFNGFEIGLGPGDLIIGLLRNNDRRLVLNCSLTVAQALAEALLEAVNDMETATGTKAVTLAQLVEARPKLEEIHRRKNQKQ